MGAEESGSPAALVDARVQPVKGWGAPLSTRFTFQVTYKGEKPPDVISLKVVGASGERDLGKKQGNTLSDDQLAGNTPIEFSASDLPTSLTACQPRFHVETAGANPYDLTGPSFYVFPFWGWVFFTLLGLGVAFWVCRNIYSWGLSRVRIKTWAILWLTIITFLVLVFALIVLLWMELPLWVLAVLAAVDILAFIVLGSQRTRDLPTKGVRTS
jgi:hypothetical protein